MTVIGTRQEWGDDGASVFLVVQIDERERERELGNKSLELKVRETQNEKTNTIQEDSEKWIIHLYYTPYFSLRPKFCIQQSPFNV